MTRKSAWAAWYIRWPLSTIGFLIVAEAWDLWALRFWTLMAGFAGLALFDFAHEQARATESPEK